MIQVTNRLPSEHEYGRVHQLSIQSLSAGTLDVVDERLAEIFTQYPWPQLEIAVLSGVPDTTDRTVVALARNATNLQGLDLSKCSLVSDIGILEVAAKCLDLQWLRLAGVVGLTDPCISAVAKSCPHLEELDGCSLPLITPSSIRDIWSFSRKLRSLRLAHCPLLTDKAFPASLKARLASQNHAKDYLQDTVSTTWMEGLSPLVLLHTADALRVLDLSYSQKVTDDAIEGIVSHAPRIQTFIASGCPLLTDATLSSLCKLSHHLDILVVAHVSNITDRGVVQLARACPNLRCVDVAFCRNLTDMSVFELAALGCIRRLSLMRVHKLTDIGISSIAEHAKHLERLNLSYCDSISLEAIHSLLRKLGYLQRLTVSGIPSCRRKGIQRFSEPAPPNHEQALQDVWRVFIGRGITDLRNFLDKEECRRQESEFSSIPFSPREDDSTSLY